MPLVLRRRAVEWQPWRRRHGGAPVSFYEATPPTPEAASPARKVTSPFSCKANYVYEDHPADIRIRSRGSLAECLAGLAVGVHAYMTDPKKVQQRFLRSVECAKAATLPDLVFEFVNHVFQLYGEDYFIVRAIQVRECGQDAEGLWFARADCAGEQFDSSKHSQGTEVKAITKHDMQVDYGLPGMPGAPAYDVCILVDI